MSFAAYVDNANKHHSGSIKFYITAETDKTVSGDFYCRGVVGR
jgi:hypothetical protein